MLKPTKRNLALWDEMIQDLYNSGLRRLAQYFYDKTRDLRAEIAISAGGNIYRQFGAFYDRIY